MKAILLAPFTRSQVTEGFQRGFSKVAETQFLRADSFVGDFHVGAFTFLIKSAREDPLPFREGDESDVAFRFLHSAREEMSSTLTTEECLWVLG